MFILHRLFVVTKISICLTWTGSNTIQDIYCGGGGAWLKSRSLVWRFKHCCVIQYIHTYTYIQTIHRRPDIAVGSQIQNWTGMHHNLQSPATALYAAQAWSMYLACLQMERRRQTPLVFYFEKPEDPCLCTECRYACDCFYVHQIKKA